jgi:hypothetical protein
MVFVMKPLRGFKIEITNAGGVSSKADIDRNYYIWSTGLLRERFRRSIG